MSLLKKMAMAFILSLTSSLCWAQTQSLVENDFLPAMTDQQRLMQSKASVEEKLRVWMDTWALIEDMQERTQDDGLKQKLKEMKDLFDQLNITPETFTQTDCQHLQTADMGSSLSLIDIIAKDFVNILCQPVSY